MDYQPYHLDVQKFSKPQPRQDLRVCPGLWWDSLTFCQMVVSDHLHYIATFTPSEDPYYLSNSWLAWRKSRSGRFREHNSRCNTETSSPQPVHCTDYADPCHYVYPLKFQRHVTYVHFRIHSLAEKFLRQACGRELINDTPFTRGGRYTFNVCIVIGSITTAQRKN